MSSLRKVAFGLTCALLGLLAAFILLSYPSSPSRREAVGPFSVAQEMRSLFERHALSGAYLIANRQGTVAEGASGWADPATQTPITLATRFNLGSVAKQFTGYVILDLIREKKLSLDDRLDHHLPELRDSDSASITLRELVHMTSGLPAILPLAAFVGLQFSDRIRSSQEFLDEVKGLRIPSDKRHAFQYTNVGYSLLAQVAARIEGTEWERVLHKRVFGPLGMNDSLLEGVRPERPENLAVGLFPIEIPLVRRTRLIALPHWNYSMIQGAGAIVSTARDMNLWNQHLSRRQKEDPEWALEYFESRGDQEKENSYSYGWFKKKRPQFYSHDGEDPGYCALTLRSCDGDKWAIFLWNTDYCLKSGWINRVTPEILSALGWVGTGDRI